MINEGVEKIEISGRNEQYTKGDTILINPGDVHTGCPASDIGWQYKMFYIDVDIIENLLLSSGFSSNYVTNTNKISNPGVFKMISMCHEAFSKSSLVISKEVLFLELLVEIYKNYGCKPIFSNKLLTKKNDLKNAIEFIEDNWSSNITLDDLESVCSINKFEIIRSFKDVFGITPHQYIITIKIKHAKKMILSGVKLGKASVDCGFYDQSHLNRNFKRMFGFTPKKVSCKYN